MYETVQNKIQPFGIVVRLNDEQGAQETFSSSNLGELFDKLSKADTGVR